jgi:hypothetical protein
MTVLVLPLPLVLVVVPVLEHVVVVGAAVAWVEVTDWDAA